MLYDVTALFLTSTALGHAVEASSVPAGTSISQVVATGAPGSDASSQSAASLVPISPSDISHAVPVSVFEIPQAPKELNSLSGIPLLSELARLPTQEVESFASTHSGVIEGLITSPPAPADVATWWSSLAPSERNSLATSTPRLIGNLGGIPTAVRNVANRAWVSHSLASMKMQASTDAGRAIAGNDAQKVAMLKQIDAALTTTKKGPSKSLLSVNTHGQGKAAIVIGDLKTADYVTYMVPGMFFTVDGQVKDWTGDATDLYSQQVAWLNRVHPVAPGHKQKTVAVVAWMGYQTPDLTNIGSLTLAYQGRDALASAIEGMRAERAGNLPYTTIVAHSYGSTAALLMLSQYDFSVNSFVMVGSPGSSVASASDLHVTKGHVYVGVAAWDPVPSSAFFGNDPAAPDFGAKSMGVGGEVDPITGETLSASIGHNDYFGKGSESIRNMALIGIDRADLISSK